LAYPDLPTPYTLDLESHALKEDTSQTYLFFPDAIPAMASTSTKALVLNGPEDWFDWLDGLRDLARSRRVWDLVDPEVEPDAIYELIEPEIPTIDDVVPPAAPVAAAAAAAAGPAAVPAPRPTFATLTEAQRTTFGLLQKQYAIQYAQWQARDSALQHVNDVIKATTGQHYQAYIAGVWTAYDRLRELRTRVAPVDKNRLNDARRAYRASLRDLKRTA
jgi:hypothetical protein